MKTSALFAMLLVASQFIFANNETGLDLAKCRDYTPRMLEGLSATKKVEHDLTNAVWTFNNELKGDKTFQFTTEGLLQILHTDKSGFKTYESIFWKVDEFGNKPFLILSNDNGKERLMSITQTCEGMILTDIACNETIALDYQPLKSSAKLNLAKAYLVGEWTNVSMFESSKAGEQPDGAFLNYHFFADGTYVCQFGNSKTDKQEKGFWELSKDSQYLLLHIDEDKNNSTKVIRVAQVDDHGLVLEQVMKSSDINDFFKSNNKTYAFIK